MSSIHNERRLNEARFLTLKQAGVKFVRYTSFTISDLVRSKSVPIKNLLNNPDPEDVNTNVLIPEAAIGGCPKYEDHILDETSCTAESSLVLRPDFGSLRILPHATSNAMVLGTLHDQITGEPSPFCTRTILKNVIDKAEKELNMTFNVGAEIEFCLVRPPCASSPPHQSFEVIDRSLYGGIETLDNNEDLINAIYERLEGVGIEIEQLHSESAHGQFEVVLKYQKDPMQLADNVVYTKDIIKACAREFGLVALFIPKIFDEQAGNGMHLHLSLCKSSTTKQMEFSDVSQPRGIAAESAAFIEGILKHLPSVMSITLPSTSSFSRVAPGCFTGSTASWNIEDKESPIRIVRNSKTKLLDHFEYKICDSTANIYLALATILSAGIDGIERQMLLRPSFKEQEKTNEVEALTPNFTCALEALGKDEVLLNALGKRLCNDYIVVKKEETKFTQDMSLSEEVALAMPAVKRAVQSNSTWVKL